MPREHRKRGKRKKNEEKSVENDQEPQDVHMHDDTDGQPSWIETAPVEAAAFNPDAPFGFCDPDVKAYFRTVDKQLAEWQELGIENQLDGPEDPNQERRMFFAAALSEMQGKERQLATDPDCAAILERMIHSMDDLARRIFANSLLGSIIELSKHRFGSHVLETLLDASTSTVDRECRGIVPAAQNMPQFSGQLSMVQLVLQLCDEVLPDAAAMVNEQFASHVLRHLFIVLDPRLGTFQDKQELRSKRSAGYKAKLGPLRSVFEVSQQEHAKGVPVEFGVAARKLINSIRVKTSASEVRALAADKVACPTLRIILALEAIVGDSDAPNSFMDDILMGMITHNQKSSASTPAESDYIGTLLRDTTASHLLETLIEHAPSKVISLLWDTYLSGKLNRTGVHPVANFVVSAIFGRLEGEKFVKAVEEMKKVVPKCLKQQRIGPVTAMVNRAATLNLMEAEIVQAICDAVSDNAETSNGLIERLLGIEGLLEPPTESREHAQAKSVVSVQGALLLQAILKMQAPHNEAVIKSFELLSPKGRRALAHDATSSRVIDEMLESPTISRKSKRSVVMSYIGEYELLVDDRIGSRVGDRCWAHADPYLKEKIARSLMQHQSFLAASYYGKFFARKLQLSLLQRRPEEWKTMQTKPEVSKPVRSLATSRNVGPVITGEKDTSENYKMAESMKTKKRKRDADKDEIDVLFDGVKENKHSKVEISLEKSGGQSVHEKAPKQKDLDSVLSAIKVAPKSEPSRRRK